MHRLPGLHGRAVQGARLNGNRRPIINPDIVETVNVARGLPWAVQYFFLIGLSYGAYLVSLPGLVFRRPGWEGISRLALLAALVCGLTAPVALLADLHQPGRFWHVYAYFAPSSWMSWGAFFIPVYLTGLILYAWLAFRPALARHADEGGKLAGLARRLAYGGHESRNALVAAALLAFVGTALVALYTGVEVMRARPLRHTPLLPLLPLQFFVTALARDRPARAAFGVDDALDDLHRRPGSAEDRRRRLQLPAAARQLHVGAAELRQHRDADHQPASSPVQRDVTG